MTENTKNDLKQNYLKIIALVAKDGMFNETLFSELFDSIWEVSSIISKSTQ